MSGEGLTKEVVPGETLELPLDVEEKPLSFIQEVKGFWNDTDGGAVPVSLAAAMTGLTKQRVHQLIAQEVESAGTGLRAKKWNKTILVYIKDIEAYWDRPKNKGGYHQHEAQKAKE